MKLKTTIYGKSSTLIGTPEEVAEFLTKVRHTTPQRVVELTKAIKAKVIVFHEPFKPTFEPIAQTREEIVKEAIADVADLLGREYTSGHTPEVVEHVGTVISFNLDDRIDFFVNKKKRVVAAKVWIDSSIGTAKDKSYATTGIARCAPSDVFNEHIGKAIALRRALGLTVPAKYYEVGGMMPEGKQVGDVAQHEEDGEVVMLNERNDNLPEGETAHFESSFANESKVIDDSARYVAPSTPAAKVVYVD